MISQTDLVERFGEEEIARLSDHDEYRTINTAVVAKAIADAEAEVNCWRRSTATSPRSAWWALPRRKRWY